MRYLKELQLIEENALKNNIIDADIKYLDTMDIPGMTLLEMQVLDTVCSKLCHSHLDKVIDIMSRYINAHRHTGDARSVGQNFEETIESLFCTYPQILFDWIIRTICNNQSNTHTLRLMSDCLHAIKFEVYSSALPSLLNKLNMKEQLYLMYWTLIHVVDFRIKFYFLSQMTVPKSSLWHHEYKKCIEHLFFYNPSVSVEKWSKWRDAYTFNQDTYNIFEELSNGTKELINNVDSLVQIPELCIHPNVLKYHSLEVNKLFEGFMSDSPISKIYNHIDTPRVQSIMIDGKTIDMVEEEFTLNKNLLETLEPLSSDMLSRRYVYLLYHWEAEYEKHNKSIH